MIGKHTKKVRRTIGGSPSDYDIEKKKMRGSRSGIMKIMIVKVNWREIAKNIDISLIEEVNKGKLEKR